MHSHAELDRVVTRIALESCILRFEEDALHKLIRQYRESHAGRTGGQREREREREREGGGEAAYAESENPGEDRTRDAEPWRPR